MPDNSLLDIPLDPDREGDSTMAGVEAARHDFYADLADRLGLKVFRQLGSGDLWAEQEELAALHAETLLLLQHVASEEHAHWGYRLGNILNAIERASAFTDGVVYVG
jgi:hypothetical protein